MKKSEVTASSKWQRASERESGRPILRESHKRKMVETIFISTSLSSSCCRNVRIKINTLILTSIRWYKLNKFIHFVHIKNNNNDNNSGIYSSFSSFFFIFSYSFDSLHLCSIHFTSFVYRTHSLAVLFLLLFLFSLSIIIVVIVCFILRSKCHKCLLSDIHVASRTHNRRWTLMGTHLYIYIYSFLFLYASLLWNLCYRTIIYRDFVVAIVNAAHIVCRFCSCLSLGIGDVRRTFLIQFIWFLVSVNECDRAHPCDYTAILCRFLIQSGSYACLTPHPLLLPECSAAVSDIRMK